MTDRERISVERLRAYIDGLEVYVGTGNSFRADIRLVLAALEAAEQRAEKLDEHLKGSVRQRAQLREKVAAMEPVVAKLSRWSRMPSCRCKPGHRCQPCNVLLELCADVAELEARGATAPATPEGA